MVVRARESIEPVLLSAPEARLLARKPRTPALIVEGVAFTAAGDPVELARTYVRSDRTRYFIERSVLRASWTRSLLPQIAEVGDGFGSRSAIVEEVAHR
jgi:hypothetical protein